jgi:invasion protein IalB
LPDVRTDELLPRSLIRDLNSGAGMREIAFKAPSLPCQSNLGLTLPRNIKGSTLMGPSKHRARSAATRRNPFAASPQGGILAILFWLGLTAAASAQGAVRSVHGDWQIRCDTPPGAQGEQCALIQSVVAEDRSNAGLTVIVLKTADQKSKLMRVVAPLGVLLPSGLGLKLDNVDVGRAGFVRCLPNGCVAEVVMDDKLLGQLRTAKTATFIIFETPEEGIGFPLSLNGLGEGYDKLP